MPRERERRVIELPWEPMRKLRDILSWLSLLLLIAVLFFWMRSYARYEGVLHYGDAAPLVATAVGEGETLEGNVRGRSTGWVSYRGRLTYVTIANPLRADVWEAWSEAIAATPSPGAKRLVMEVAAQSAMGGGSGKTQMAIEGQGVSLPLRLPYHYLTVPYWLLALLLAIAPWRWIERRRLVAQRVREGRCVNCGHELVGGACPKCKA
jgi:4-amino-4-deoxy-L-arabinose transferase-like glycosyltransferase